MSLYQDSGLKKDLFTETATFLLVKDLPMVRMVQDPPSSGNLISIQEWRRRQAAMQAAVVAQNARVPQSQKEDYDYTFRAPKSWKLEFDFTQ